MKHWLAPCLLIAVVPAAAAAWELPAIEGWEAAGEVELYDPGNLWKRIDGAAELFLAYDFQQLLAQDLSSGDLRVAVEVYDMGTRLNAFGVYGTERSEESETVEVGTEGVVAAPYQCLMLKDRFYVKVETQAGKLKREEGIAFLRGLDEALPGADSLPRELELLPQRGRIAGSEGYARRGHLGLGELRNCLFAEYGSEEAGTYEIFALLPDPEESVLSIWDSLATGWTAVEGQARPILLRTVPYRGTIGVVRTERGIFGAAAFEEQAQLLEILKGLIEPVSR